MDSQVAEKIKVSPKRRRDAFVDLWAKTPQVLRFIAVTGVLVTVLAVGIGFWSSRNNQVFKLKGEKPQLSMNVTAVINGYERRVTNGDRLELLIRADRETTFDDERHELDNVLIENYPEGSEKPDRITAVKAVYTPDASNPENFTVSFTGNVNFESRDGVQVLTEQISYDRVKEYAETASSLNFKRENISGSAVGAKLHVKDKKVELQNQVEINVAPNGNLAKNSLTDFGSSAVKINSMRAGFDQNLERFELEQGVNIVITPQDGGNVPTTIRAEKAVYEKDLQKLDLSGGVEIVSASDNVSAIAGTNQKAGNSIVPVTIRADAASYEQGNGKIHLNGNASVQQGNELMNGDAINADINKQKKLEKVFTRGNAFLRTASAERTTEVNAVEMFFQFDTNQQILNANASGSVTVRSLTGDNLIQLNDSNAVALNFKPNKDRSLLEKLKTEGNTNVSLTANNSADYSNVQMLAPNWTEVLFVPQTDKSVLKQMTTGGRTTVTMTAPQSQSQNPKATNKKLIADTLKLFWNTSGKDLSRAEAVGNAELYIFPLGSAPDVDKQSLFAARFDCSFYDTGNLAKTFTATGTAKGILEPTQPTEQRGVKNLWSEKMSANFQQGTQAVESFIANGNAKFNELDRNGTANSFNYTASDEVVRLRGGEPTVWDSRARLKAVEIDWDTRREISYMRGKVATTYYSQEQTGGATPFTKVNAPVFLVSNQAEFNHATGVAIYTGNARAWQDNNFVRADKLVLQRDNKSMYGEGKVNSALYNAKRRDEGKESTVPVIANSDRMTYSDVQKLLRYESSVDIRQGTDRITGGVAEVFLNANNDVEKTIAQNSVVVTQPGRRATGDWAQYTTADEVVVLKGNPATVEDAEQGASQGRQLTVYLRQDRIEGQGGTTANAPGRVRSTHRVKKQ